MKRLVFSKGFTLVELLVSLGILAILISLVLFTLDPIFQYNKALDGQRKHDLLQIKNALDLYYNDNNCYPNYLPFGSEWADGETVLMKKVPDDPSPYFVAGEGYYYYNYTSDITENASCPQWNILFAYLRDKAYTKVDSEKSCQTMIAKVCPDIDYKPRYNYCIFSGNLDCEVLSQLTPPPLDSQRREVIHPTPTLTPIPTPTLTPIPTPTLTPIPTPTLILPQLDIDSPVYGCSANQECNSISSENRLKCPQVCTNECYYYCDNNSATCIDICHP